jgi:hypothetical protein
MENAMALLVVTWVVQGIINANKTGEIQRLQREVEELKKATSTGRSV